MAEAETVGDYTILKGLQFEEKSKVKRVLPEWLSHPSVVSVDLQNLSTKITDLEDLDPLLAKRLAENNISHFFPIQAQLIPWILKKHRAPKYLWPCDICVSSPTGSGKTLAFALPIIQILKERLIPKVRALIVLPTQDLAAQVFEVFQEYIKGTTLEVALITGGSTALQKEQASLVSHCPVNGIESKVDIVVTTPGRLLDHLDVTPGFSLSSLEFLVIDEADRILDDFRLEWLQHLEKHLSKGALAAPPVSLHTLKTAPTRPQRLLFSATLSQDPEKLQQLGLFQPKLFTAAVDEEVGKSGENSSVFVGKFTTPKELMEKYVQCTVASKPLFLYHFLVTENWSQVLCFVHSVEMTHTLTLLLQRLSKLDNKKLNVAEISSEKHVKNRLKIIKEFEEGKIDVLVTSDRLARGINIPNAKYVISFDTPKFAKNYIHRIGRTGRAGQSGTALTLVSGKEVNKFNELLMATKKVGRVTALPFSRRNLHQYEDVFKKALESMKLDKQNTVKTNLERIKSDKKSGKFQSSKAENPIHRKDIRRKKADAAKEILQDGGKKTDSDSSKENKVVKVKKMRSDLTKETAKKSIVELPKGGQAKREFIKAALKAKWQNKKAEKMAAKLKKEKEDKRKEKKKLKKKLKKSQNPNGGVRQNVKSEANS